MTPFDRTGSLITVASLVRVSFSLVLPLWADGCAGLPNIPHAIWGRYGYQQPTEEAVYDIGTELRYSCFPGYKPKADGPTTVTCQRNLEWTPYIQCEGEFLFLKFFCILNIQYVIGFSILNEYNFFPQDKFRIILIEHNSEQLLPEGTINVLELEELRNYNLILVQNQMRQNTEVKCYED